MAVRGRGDADLRLFKEIMTQGGEHSISPFQAGCDLPAREAPVPACQSSRTRAGFRVRSNTLRANRETLVVSMVERGPYGPIEDFSGDVTVEVLPTCCLNVEADQTLAAMGLADEEVASWLAVSEWDAMRVGNLVVLTPRVWEEVGGRGYRPAVAQEPRSEIVPKVLGVLWVILLCFEVVLR